MKTALAEIFRFLFKIDFIRRHYFGIYERVFKPFNLFHGIVRRVAYNGFILELHIDDWIQQNLFFLREYEKSEIETLNLLLPKGGICFDVGANIGLYTLHASGLVGEKGKVFSFEPFAANYNRLCKNIVLNNARNVHPEKLAIGEKPGLINLYCDPREKNLGMVSAEYSESALVEEVQMIDLDTYFKNSATNRIDVIKIDIEGFEYAALLGMRDTLATYSPALLVEILPDTGLENTERIHDLLKLLGYKKYFIRDNGTISETETNPNRFNYVFTKNHFPV